MEINIKDAAFLATQVVIVTTMIINNRQNITHLKQQQLDLKEWIKSLQEKVNDLRVKVGI
jgi:peptidoglycan hydrolase CwlO-like protein|tara:strand:+ start:48821 stop:49000 length:180 start_codon:yes stop_codon:yes gene_type:complete